MFIDIQLVILVVGGALLFGLAQLVGWNAALGVFIIAAIAWSASPLNGPTKRD